MITKKTPIVIVWLKRDLRLEDHEALSFAMVEKESINFICCRKIDDKKQSL